MSTLREVQAELKEKRNAPVEGEEFTEETEEVELVDDPIEDVELDEESEEDQPIPAIEPPAGWSEEEKEVFQELTPTVQEALIRKERERDGLMTQKSQKLSEQLKETEEKAKLLKDKEERYESALQRQAQNAPTLPDAELLDETSEKYDPDQYHKSRAKYDTALAKQQEAGAELSKLNDEHKEENREMFREWQGRQGVVYSKILPEMAESQSSAKGMADKLHNYVDEFNQRLAVQGIPESDWLNHDAVNNASAVEIALLNDSRVLHEARSKEPKKARKASPSLRPGSPKPAGAASSKNIEQLKARAKKTGSIRDAQALLKATRIKGK